MTLAPVPRPDIAIKGNLTPTWQAWFYELYAWVTGGLPGSPVPSTRLILTTPPLAGGGDLSVDRTLSINANGITNALLAQMPANTLKGNNTAGTANALDLTVSQVNALLGTPVGANPTASVGLTAVNGVATSFLRSDGAPALSQAIVPTWSAQHTFTLAPIFSSPLLATSGGTGFASYTQGDLLYASSGTVLSRLADVAAGGFLRSGGVGANPAWSAITVPNAGVLGDLWYGSAASVISALAGNTSATKKFLTQTGTGAVSAAPAWNTIAAADLPGSFSGFANPSASVALTAVNGSATTAMRSDAAPQLDVSISPTWTGNHTHSPSSGAAIIINAPTSTTALSYKAASGQNAFFDFFSNGAGSRQALIGAAAGAGFLITGSALGDLCLRVASGNLLFSNDDGTTAGLKVAASGSTFRSALGVNNNAAPAQVTGFGTPTGTGVIANFPGATATLAQCSQAIAQIIKDLKAFGLYAA